MLTDSLHHVLRILCGLALLACQSFALAAIDSLPALDQAPSIQRSNTLAAVVGFPSLLSVQTTAHASSYQWALVSRPAQSVALLANPSIANPFLTPDVPGTYEVIVTIISTTGGITTEKLEVLASPA